jgi:hypothetical protein
MPQLQSKIDAKDSKKVKDYLKAKGVKQSDLDKKKWSTSDEIIQSVVELHGGKMDAYRSGGLG